MKKSEPVLLWMSILAGLQTFFAGSTATTVMIESDRILTAVFAFGALAVGAAQFGVQVYVKGKVVPTEDVVEMRTTDGRVIAGEANEVVPVGSTVREVGGRTAQQKRVVELQEALYQAELQEAPSDFTLHPPTGEGGPAGPGVAR